MRITKRRLRRIIREELLREIFEAATPTEEEGVSSMDAVQASLDAAGLVPGFGEIADGINALISVGRGDFVGAGLSLVSMVPIVGDAIGKGGKVARMVMKNPVVKKAAKSGAKVASKMAAKSPKAAKQIKVAGEKIAAAKTAMTKNSGKIKDMHKAVINKDLGALEKLTGKKIPNEHRKAFQAALDQAGDKIKDADLSAMMKSMERTIEAAEEVGDEKKEGTNESHLYVQILDEQYMHDVWEDLKWVLHEQRVAAAANLLLHPDTLPRSGSRKFF